MVYRFLMSVLAGATLATSLVAPVAAQSYPGKTVSIVVPFPAGGGPDLLARALAEKLAPRLGQPVLVDNKPGAGGLLGASGVARAPADGHVLLLAPNTLVISPHVLPKGAGGGIDVNKDLAPIVSPASTPMVLLAHPQLGVSNLEQLVALARRSPGLAYASAGNGSPMHFAGEMFQKSAGVQLLHVPYRGAAPALAAALGGEVKLLYTGLGAAIPLIKSGKLVPLALTEKARSRLAPSLPTAAEQGFRNVEVNAWYGLFAPSGTPVAVVERLNREVNEVLKSPELRERLEGAGLEVGGGTAQQLAGLMKEDFARYGRIAQELNIKAD
ncbi:tripartite tricarboxylate transporter substrate-binding protein [Ramlibacter sp. 2FC]|uniref:Bug family tripartite tricarboxylate transporter substrate binding protein n=1 Tax=Ramlibacter sp. 2FC TaxID=2502188 RepID=UPI001484CB59|nr:tripartite tricarboxylate transporter substrate-binding protein [Ramlibacter sp. 2FC]